MTKEEFNIIFSSSVKAVVERSTKESIRATLLEYSENEKTISNENLAILAITESIKINNEILRSVLSAFLITEN